MIDCVDARDRVEFAIREWQSFRGIHRTELRPVCQSQPFHERLCSRDCLLMNVNAYDEASCFLGNPEGWTAGAAGDIQQSLLRRKAEVLDESVLLIGSEPTVLSNVFSERFTPNRGIEIGFEIPVISVVVTGSWFHR
jgi:hypothetical protein